MAIEKLNHYTSLHNLPVRGIVADVREFTIAPQYYDLICAVTILDHLLPDAAVRLAHSIYEGLVEGGVLFAEVFTVDDPGYAQMAGASETAQFVRHYFNKGELRNLFSKLNILRYEENNEIDSSHGEPHVHGVAILLAKKP